MRKSISKGIAGIVALAVIVFAGLQIKQQLRHMRGGHNRSRSGGRATAGGGSGGSSGRHAKRGLIHPVAEAASPRKDPIRVVAWWVETRPALVAADCPKLTEASNLQYCVRSPSDLPTLAPAVALHVGILVEGRANGQGNRTSQRPDSPTIWPGLQRLELLRSDGAGQSLKVVQTETRKHLDGLKTRTGYPSGETALYRYDFSLVDTSMPVGRPLQYKVRFIASKPPASVPAESAICTAVAFDLPKAKLVHRSGKRPSLQWNAGSGAIPALIKQAEIVLGTTRSTYGTGVIRESTFTELGRAALAAGKLDLPSETLKPGFTFPLGYAIEGVWTAKAWSSLEGELRLDERCALCRPIALPGFHLSLPFRHRKGEFFTFRPRVYSSIFPTGDRLPENQGIEIFCYYASKPKADMKLRVQAADGGPAYDLVPGRTGRWTVMPGLPMRLDITTAGKINNAKRTLQCSMVRPAYPTGFRVRGGDKQVRLRWDPLTYSREDWVQGPEFVVRRTCADTARVRPGQRLDFNNATSLRVVYRGPASVTETVDRHVLNDHGYLYTLSIEGITRVKGELSGGTVCPFHMPVRVWYRPGGGRLANLAAPHAPRPFRLAITCPDQANPGAEFLRRALVRRFGREAWIRLVERTDVSRLSREEQLAALGQGSADSARGFSKRIAADAVISVACKQIGTRRNLMVWWIDYQNAFSRRLQQVSMWHADLNKIADEALVKLKDELGEETLRTAFAAVAPATAGVSKKPVAALLGLAPLSLSNADTELPSKGLEDLLNVALGSSRQWQTVDREHLTAVLSELGNASAFSASGSLKLGKLLGADIVLQGWYTITGNDLALSLQALDVHRGVHLRNVTVSGSANAPDEVMAEAVKRLGSMTTASDGPASPPLLLAAEAQVSASGPNRTRRAPRRSYLERATPKSLLALGHAMQASSLVSEALDAYRRGLDMALQQTGYKPIVVALAEAMDQLFRRNGRPDERIRLWRRVLSYAEQHNRISQVPDIRLRLAKALLDKGDKEAASRVLLQVRNPPRQLLARTAGILEELGRSDAALTMYLQANWTVRGHVADSGSTERLGPAYPAILRYVRRTRGAKRYPLLTAIVRNLAAIHPVQALQAYNELCENNAEADVPRSDVWRMTKALGDAKRVDRFADSLLRESPGTVEYLRLWNNVAHYYLQHNDVKRAATFAQRVNASRLHTAPAAMQKQLAQKYLKLTNGGRVQAADQKQETMPDQPIIDNSLRAYVAGGGGRQVGRVGVEDLYVLTENGFVLRLSPKADALRWSCSLGYRSPFPRRARKPTERQSLLYRINNLFWVTPDSIYAVNVEDGILFAIDSKTGRIRWRHTDWTHLSAPVVLPRQKQVMVANAFGELEVFSTVDGKLLHRAEGPRYVTDSFRDGYVDLQAEYSRKRFLVSLSPTPLSAARRNPETLRDPNSLRMHSQGLVAVQEARGSYWFEAPDFTVHEIGSAAHLPSFGSLAKKLRDKSIPDRRQLMLIAGWKGVDQETTQALLAICRDSDEPDILREDALRTLARTLGDAAPQLLIQALGMKEYGLRLTASQELNFLISEGKISLDTMSMLARMTRQASGEARGSLVRALVNVAGYWAKPALRDILSNPKDPLFDSVLTSLSTMGDPDMLALLQKHGYIEAWLKKPTDQQLGILARYGIPAAQARVRAKIDMKGLLTMVRQAKTLSQKKAVTPRAKSALTWIRNSLPDPAYLPALRQLADGLRDDKGRCLVSYDVGWACVAVDGPDSIPILLHLQEMSASLPGGSCRRVGYPSVQPLAVAAGVDFGCDFYSWHARFYKKRSRSQRP